MPFRGVLLDVSDPNCTSIALEQWAIRLHNMFWSGNEEIINFEQGVRVLHEIFTPEKQPISIMAREEYDLIWEYVLGARTNIKRNGKGLVVFGHPGIGKSLFLYFALAHALRAKIPVAFCLGLQDYFFFDNSGVWVCPYSEIAPGCKIVLVDSVEERKAPSYTFYHPQASVYIVHAASPKVSSYKSWSKEARARIWVMKLWSRQEIESLRRLIPTDDNLYDPATVAHHLGPSVRNCMEDWPESGNPAVDFRWPTPGFDHLSSIFRPLEVGSTTSIEGPGYHRYFYIIPDPTIARPTPAAAPLPIKTIIPDNVGHKSVGCPPNAPEAETHQYIPHLT